MRFLWCDRVRFTGDSGAGMQQVGSQFTQVTGLAGNDVITFPDFPAEIRAPQGPLWAMILTQRLHRAE